jgi:tRNA uridine 5-carboxymethylaminomethyl modification enzyme
VTPNRARDLGLNVNLDGIRRNGMALLALPDVNLATLARLEPGLNDCPSWAADLLETEGKYSVYLDRQAEDMARVARDRDLIIPEGLDYDAVAGLSNELRHKLQSIRPRSVFEASQIEGMTPAGLVLLTAVIRKAAA